MHYDYELKWLQYYNFILSVSQEFMSSLFVMLTSFWMEVLEHKTELFCFLSLTERIDVVINSMDDDFWG